MEHRGADESTTVATPVVPADDGLWELALGALLAALTLTVHTGRMPLLVVVAAPVAAALLRFRVTRPRLGAAESLVGPLELGPLGLLCLLVVAGAAVIGWMARDGREAFGPAESAAPGISAAAILALGVLSALVGTHLRARRLLVWGGLAVVGLLLEPLADPRAREWSLGLLALAMLLAGAARAIAFLRAHPRPTASED